MNLILLLISITCPDGFYYFNGHTVTNKQADYIMKEFKESKHFKGCTVLGGRVSKGV